MSRYGETFDSDEGQDFRVDNTRSQPEGARSKIRYRAVTPAKRTAPASYNGIHRRRKRRIMW